MCVCVCVCLCVCVCVCVEHVCACMCDVFVIRPHGAGPTLMARRKYALEFYLQNPGRNAEKSAIFLFTKSTCVETPMTSKSIHHMIYYSGV
jgi:hypothetical protein